MDRFKHTKTGRINWKAVALALYADSEDWEAMKLCADELDPFPFTKETTMRGLIESSKVKYRALNALFAYIGYVQTGRNWLFSARNVYYDVTLSDLAPLDLSKMRDLRRVWAPVVEYWRDAFEDMGLEVIE